MLKMNPKMCIYLFSNSSVEERQYLIDYLACTLFLGLSAVSNLVL